MIMIDPTAANNEVLIQARERHIVSNKPSRGVYARHSFRKTRIGGLWGRRHARMNYPGWIAKEFLDVSGRHGLSC
jgi:hypothetical protein